jgi:hypothetical protein
MSRCFAALFAVTWLTLCSGTATARTWHVLADGSGDAPTIQAGIDSSVVGDTVLVGPGTYSESINFAGKAISLIAPSGPGATVIQGSPSEPVITFNHDESQKCLLMGLTVQGGRQGILVAGAEPVIKDNVVRNNGPRGGITITDTGVNSQQRSPTIQGNTVISNRAEGGGGGISIAGNMAPKIVDNRILGNITDGGDGGGVRVMVSNGGMVITGNLVVGNVADDHGGGMLIAVPSFRPETRRVEVSQNVIMNNVALGNGHFVTAGGGVMCYWTTGPVENNTFVNNAGYGGGWFGGNLSIDSYEPVTVEVSGNILVGAEAGGGLAAYREVTVNATNNLFWHNAPQDMVIPGTAPVIEEDDIYADPLLCDEQGGDGSVSIHSPCLSSPGGVIGAISVPGCDRVPVERTTWGQIKARYR